MESLGDLRKWKNKHTSIARKEEEEKEVKEEEKEVKEEEGEEKTMTRKNNKDYHYKRKIYKYTKLGLLKNMVFM